MDRILEPELMTDAAQAVAYAGADFVQINQGFVDRLRTGMSPGPCPTSPSPR